MGLLTQNITAVKAFKKNIDSYGTSWVRDIDSSAYIQFDNTLRKKGYTNIVVMLSIDAWKTSIVELDNNSFALCLDLSSMLTFKVECLYSEQATIRSIVNNTFEPDTYDRVFGTSTVDGIKAYFADINNKIEEVEKALSVPLYFLERAGGDIISSFHCINNIFTASHNKYLPLLVIKASEGGSGYAINYLKGDLYRYNTGREVGNLANVLTNKSFITDEMMKYSYTMGLRHLTFSLLNYSYKVGSA